MNTKNLFLKFPMILLAHNGSLKMRRRGINHLRLFSRELALNGAFAPHPPGFSALGACTPRQ